MEKYNYTNFHYDHSELRIGNKWESYNEQIPSLTFIFKKIDDGDGVVEENEVKLLNRILEIIKEKSLQNISKGNLEDIILEEQSKIENLQSQNTVLINKDQIKTLTREDFNSLVNNSYNKNGMILKSYSFDQAFMYELNTFTEKTKMFNSNNELISEFDNKTKIISYFNENNEVEYTFNTLNNKVVFYDRKNVEKNNTPCKSATPKERQEAFIQATFGTSEMLHLRLMQLTPEDVFQMACQDEESEGNLYKSIERIITNRNRSSSERESIINVLIDKFIEYAKSVGVYTDDLTERLKNNLKYEKNKIGYMNPEYINHDLVRLTRRIGWRGSPNGAAANGAVDNNFKQHGVGDCWFLATIKSITCNPKFKQLLNSQIITNSDGSVTVNLKGVKKSYTISKAELEGAKEFSAGDLDVRALEIAVDRYLRETNQRNIFRDYKLYYKSQPNADGGYLEEALFILFDNKDYKITKTYHDKKNAEDKVDSMLERLRNGEQISGYINFLETKVDNDKLEDNQYPICATKQNGNKEKLHSHHAYSLVGADDSYVYIINPWDTSVTLKISIDDFKQAFASMLLFE